MIHFKNVLKKIFAFGFLLFTITTITHVYAGGGATYCLGKPLTITYSSTNISNGCDNIVSPLEYNFTFTPPPNTTSSYSPPGINLVTTAAPGTFTMTCHQGPTPVSSSRNLSVSTTYSWDGTACVAPTGSMTLSSNTCTIATGASSCSVNITGCTTNNPIGTSAITSDTNDAGLSAPGTVITATGCAFG
jgi:hypothetical protein